MTRYFRWELSIPDGEFLKDYWENSRGGDNLASVYWLYNRTGDTFLLDLAAKIDAASLKPPATIADLNNAATCARLDSSLTAGWTWSSCSGASELR
jgi:hypothetical protein